MEIDKKQIRKLNDFGAHPIPLGRDKRPLLIGYTLGATGREEVRYNCKEPWDGKPIKNTDGEDQKASFIGIMDGKKTYVALNEKSVKKLLVLYKDKSPVDGFLKKFKTQKITPLVYMDPQSAKKGTGRGGFVHTEAEAAIKWREERGKDWVYIRNLKMWMYWNEAECSWQMGDEEDIHTSVIDFNIKYYRKKDEGISDRASSTGLANNIVTQIRNRAGERLEKWDANPNLLGIENGKVIDLKTGKTRKQKKEDRILRASRFYPQEKLDENCYTMQWLKEKFPDKKSLNYVLKYIAYSLQPTAGEQIMLWLHGPTCSGKSTFASIVEAMLGGYSTSCHNRLFQETNADKASKEELFLCRAQGKRLVTVSEYPEAKPFATTFVKQITGGDKVTGRGLYKMPFDYTPVFKVLIHSNYLPSNGFDPAIQRRTAFIEMAESHKGKIDKEASTKLLSEQGLKDFSTVVKQIGFSLLKKEGLRPLPETEIKLPINARHELFLNVLKTMVEEGQVIYNSENTKVRIQRDSLLKRVLQHPDMQGDMELAEARRIGKEVLTPRKIGGVKYYLHYQLADVDARPSSKKKTFSQDTVAAGAPIWLQGKRYPRPPDKDF